MLPVTKINSCLEPKFILCALCLVLISHSLLACISSGKHYDWQNEKVRGPLFSTYFATEKNSKVRKIKNLVKKYQEMGLHGLPISDKVVKKWTDWYNDYKKKTKDIDFFTAANRNKLKAERDADPGWPTELQWQGTILSRYITLEYVHCWTIVLGLLRLRVEVRDCPVSP